MLVIWTDIKPDRCQYRGRELGKRVMKRATLVVGVDAPLEAEGEHVFHLSLDRVLITALPITVLMDDARNDLPQAAQIRAKWMFELGTSNWSV